MSTESTHRLYIDGAWTEGSGDERPFAGTLFLEGQDRELAHLCVRRGTTTSSTSGAPPRRTGFLSPGNDEGTQDD